MHRFVSELDKLMKDYTYKNYLIYHYTSIDSAKRANSAFLMCAYCVIKKINLDHYIETVCWRGLVTFLKD
jgi:hypothetical protein